MKAILIQNGVHKAIKGDERKPIDLSEAKWEEMDAKVLSAIQLCLSDEVLREVVKEVTSKGFGRSWNPSTWPKVLPTDYS